MHSYIKNFPNVKVLVVGDVMLDKYVWGTVDRISPEAPVPVVNLENTTVTAGGAANVAANISGLGAESFLVGAVGNDNDGDKFYKILNKLNVSSKLLVKLSRPTTTKTRVVAHNQQIVRIDQEKSDDLNISEEELVWKQIEKVINKIDIVLISDYAKGIITPNLSTRLIALANKKSKYVIVDPKGKEYSKYKSATILTPNHKEACEALPLNNQHNLESVGNKLLDDLELRALIITNGEKGMSLFQKNTETRSLKALARKVYDVTGAGDTVIAALTVAIGAGYDFYEAARLANISAGLVVEKVGTTRISINDLNSELLSQK